jgi:hypothetical protein
MWLSVLQKRACRRSLSHRETVNFYAYAQRRRYALPQPRTLLLHNTIKQRKNLRNLNAPRKHTNNTTDYYCKQKMAWKQEYCDINISAVHWNSNNNNKIINDNDDDDKNSDNQGINTMTTIEVAERRADKRGTSRRERESWTSL